MCFGSDLTFEPARDILHKLKDKYLGLIWSFCICIYKSDTEINMIGSNKYDRDFYSCDIVIQKVDKIIYPNFSSSSSSSSD